MQEFEISDKSRSKCHIKRNESISRNLLAETNFSKHLCLVIVISHLDTTYTVLSPNMYLVNNLSSLSSPL